MIHWTRTTACPHRECPWWNKKGRVITEECLGSITKMFCVWFFALFLHISVKGLEVCYDRLGCFTNDPPWSGTLERPLLGLPEPPALVNTGFCIYTRENPVHSQVISAINPSTIQASNFRTNRRTCFIIHGYFLNNKDYFSIIEICKHILQKEDINCVAVKWESDENVGNFAIQIQSTWAELMNAQQELNQLLLQ
ncbi:pancreatic lipase-related protein 2-like [Hemicordylus capensis]|uniref:pancreatic lipase-related protein 2-like n=1 Tax=Hemicordylus capensis TaxID=884348 RepID=UPI002304B1F0|nr:pancreatic lipase-related protein 2-like [Hemicordylus capensis]